MKPVNTFALIPVAYVKNARREPIDDQWESIPSKIVLTDDFPAEAFEGIETFSHLHVIFFFHLDQDDPLATARHPRNNPDWPKVGIFAQRNGVRHNKIGLVTVKLLKREGKTLFVERLDAVDGTPVLDIKPVMHEFQPVGEIRQPDWVSEMLKDYW